MLSAQEPGQRLGWIGFYRVQGLNRVLRFRVSGICVTCGGKYFMRALHVDGDWDWEAR